MKNITLLTLLVLLFGCSRKESQKGESAPTISVVTTLFPIYDFTRIVAGDNASIKLLLPPGVEPHSFEPSPRDMVTIDKASLFIYLGEAMEPWAAKLSTKSKSVSLVDSIEIESADHGDHEGHEGCVHHQESDIDPHIWLDPTMAVEMVKVIEKSLVEIDPAGAQGYRNRAKEFITKLLALDAKITAALTECNTRTLLYGGHFAFGYFAKRYNLEHQSPYQGFSPNAEPTPVAVKKLIDAIENAGVSILFVEELVEPRLAKVIAEETGVSLETLHGIHNIAKSDDLNSMHYITLMESNLEKLTKGLECR